jgi:hypothetical protein
MINTNFTATTSKQVAIHVPWYSIMTQISTCVGMFQRKCCSASRFQLRYQHPVSGVIPWSTTADTDPYLNVFGTASQLADRVFVQLKTVVNCVQWSTKSLSGNRDFWEKFLSLCQLHPCLWNSKRKEYSNKHVREHAYKELVTKCKEQFPTADEEFGVKIHAFRCSFRRELKKGDRVSKVRHICWRCVCADSVILLSIKLQCRFRNPKKREVEYGLGGRDRWWR